MAGTGGAGAAGLVVRAHRAAAQDGGAGAAGEPVGWLCGLPVCGGRADDDVAGNPGIGLTAADALAAYFLLRFLADGGRADGRVSAARQGLALAGPVCAAGGQHVRRAARLVSEQQSHRLAGNGPKNQWAQAFLWCDAYTPRDAVFAGDPKYMWLHAEDAYGLRGLARRSLLAEDQKDPGAATVFPSLAATWLEQVQAQRGIERFSAAQFHQLHDRFGVTWTVLPVTATVPLECPYRNEAAQVCRVD